MTERRIGAYGGTFDPVHNGHLIVARAVAKAFELDELLLIPAYGPPHKDPRSISEAYHRYAMSVLATLDEPRISVSTIELEAPDKPYTYETVARLREAYGPESSVFFVMGADSFEELATWREPERLLASANLIAVTRPGYPLADARMDESMREKIVDLRGGRALDLDELCDRTETRIYLTDWVNADISATDIRRRAQEGKPISDLVAPAVASYIEKYGLYKR